MKGPTGLKMVPLFLRFLKFERLANIETTENKTIEFLLSSVTTFESTAKASNLVLFKVFFAESNKNVFEADDVEMPESV